MNDFLDFIIPIFCSCIIFFILMCPCFYGLNERIEKLEKFHNNEICSECGTYLYK